MYEVKLEDLPEQVYRQIKDMILNGELPAGRKLVQEDLAARLGVSRTPLLTAFRKLEKEMLVTLIPRRGAFVRENTGEDLLHIFDIRLKIEPLAARDAALRITTESFNDIRKHFRDFASAVENNDRLKYKRADYDFHYSIMEHSGNPYIPRMLSSVNLVSLSNVSGLVTDPKVSLEGHKAILKALEIGDPDAAELAMTNHLILAKKKLLEHRRTNGSD